MNRMVMSSGFPLSRVCSHRVERFQLRFAHQALEFFPSQPERAIAATSQGLVVSAETEAALEDVINVLKTVYGDALVVGELTIQYRRGPTNSPAGDEEPHMGVRVLCPAANFEAVREDLAELTGGRAREVIWLSHYAPVESLPPSAA